MASYYATANKKKPLPGAYVPGVTPIQRGGTPRPSSVPTRDANGRNLSAGVLAAANFNATRQPLGSAPSTAGTGNVTAGYGATKPGTGAAGMPTNLNDLIAWQLRENETSKKDTLGRIDALNKQLGLVGQGLAPSDETALNQASSRINAASNMASDQAAFQAAESGQAGGSGAVSANNLVERQRIAGLGQAAGDFAKNRLNEQLQIQNLRLGALSSSVIPNIQPQDLTGLGGLMVASQQGGAGGKVNAGGVQLNLGAQGLKPVGPSADQAAGKVPFMGNYGPGMPPVSANELEAIRNGRFRQTMALNDPRLEGLQGNVAGRKPAVSNGQSTYAQSTMSGQPWVSPEQSFIYGQSNPMYGTSGTPMQSQGFTTPGAGKYGQGLRKEDKKQVQGPQPLSQTGVVPKGGAGDPGKAYREQQAAAGNYDEVAGYDGSRKGVSRPLAMDPVTSSSPAAKAAGHRAEIARMLRSVRGGRGRSLLAPQAQGPQ